MFRKWRQAPPADGGRIDRDTAEAEFFYGYLFDQHFMDLGLVEPSQYRPEVRFLVEEEAYEERQRKSFELQLDDFVVHSIHRRERKDYVWKALVNSWQPDYGVSGSPYWGFQIPFLFFPNQENILYVGKHNSRVPVSICIQVWPSGWSTNLGFGLRQASLQQIRELTTGMRSPFEKGFVLGSSMVSLSGVFSHFASALKEALLTSESSFGFDSIVSSSKLVAGYARNVTEVPRYPGKGSGSGKSLWDSERAVIHSIVLAREVGILELHKLEGPRRQFLLTRFKGVDFAVSHLGHGTLLSASASFSKGKKNERAIKCLISNIQASEYVMDLLAQSVAVFGNQDSTDNLRRLAKLSARGLRRFPQRYSNPFCGTYAKYNTGVKRACTYGK